MILNGNKVEGIFVKRKNRFVASVKIAGKEIAVHVPNSGRLKELFVPGAKVVLRESKNLKRKYKYDLILVEKDGILVSVDSILPNALLHKAFVKKHPLLGKNPITKKLMNYDNIKREIRFGNSRFDLGFSKAKGYKYLMEIKGVTLVKNSKALFPDAPTSRGIKHLLELIRAKEEGLGAGVFFVVQREDADIFMPNDSMDREFSKALHKAKVAKVDLLSLKCSFTKSKVKLMEFIPVCL